MKQAYYAYLITFLSLATQLAGCGAGGTSPVTKDTMHESSACISCHIDRVSPVTGMNIVTEWKLSTHNTQNGAGCIDCHDDGFLHPASCSKCHNSGTVAKNPTNNPDRDGKCLKCHNSSTGYLTEQTSSGILVDSQTAHFNTIITPATSITYPPSYVTYEYTDKSKPASGNASNCRKCHNPHDPTTAMIYNKDFARSSHGMIERLPQPALVPTDGATIKYDGSLTPAAAPSIYDARMAPREENDFKTKGTTRPASQVSIDVFGCIRCHTTTGYINFVKSGFSDLNSYGPIDPATGRAYTSPATAPPVSGKEVTGCNACHNYDYTDPTTNLKTEASFNFKKLRAVDPVTIYYNYTSTTGNGGKIANHQVTYPDAGDSNNCVVCHSGRLIGLNIKMASANGLNLSKQGRITNHYRGSAEMVFQTGGFEFYSSSAKYYGAGDPNDHFSHADIGMDRLPKVQTWLASQGIVRNIGVKAGDKRESTSPRGHGPCIGCHMNSTGKETSSHTFLPVNREAGATYRPGYPFQNDPARRGDAINKVVSNACSACHGNGSGWAPADLQYAKTKYEAAALAVREVLLYALHTTDASRTIDSQGRPNAPTSNNWYGPATGDTLQSWLKSSSTNDVTGTQGFMYPIIGGDPLSGQLLQVKKAANNMGAYWNFWMMYADPGGFVHNDVYAKRLMYDTIDWLDDGILNLSVRDTFNNGLPKTGFTGSGTPLDLKARLGATTWQDAYNYLLKSDTSFTSPGTENAGRPNP